MTHHNDDPEHVGIIRAHIVMWRVVSTGTWFHNRPKGAYKWFENAPDGLRASIGDLPADLIGLVRSHARALHRGQKDSVQGWAATEAEALLRRRCLDDSICIEFRQSISVRSTLREDASWYRAKDGDREKVDAFLKSAEERVFGLISRNLSQIHSVGAARFIDPIGDALIVAPGRLPVTMLRVNPRSDLVRLADWSSVGELAFSQSFGDESPEHRSFLAVSREAMRWYLAALGEDGDNVKRFLFAFWGLEILVSKYSGKDRRDGIVSRLSSKAGVPLENLLWPTPPGDDRPQRSVLFRFALAAVTLNPEGCAEDMSEFRRLVDIRNKMSHGASLGTSLLDDEVISSTIGLLGKYLLLISEIGGVEPE